MFSWYVCLFASIRVSWVSGGAPKFEKHPCWWKTPLSPKNRKTSWCYAMPGAFGYCIPLPCSPKMPVSDICTNTQTCIHIYIYIYIYIWTGLCTYTYILSSSAKVGRMRKRSNNHSSPTMKRPYADDYLQGIPSKNLFPQAVAKWCLEHYILC